MQKVNAFNLHRPLSPVETKSFTDPEQPGQTIELTLRGLDSPEKMAALEYGNAYILTYIGDPDLGISPSKTFPHIDGRPVVISAGLCNAVAMVEYMQTSQDPNERYNFEQLVGLVVTMPTAWNAIIAWTNTLNKTVKAKNDSSAEGALTS